MLNAYDKHATAAQHVIAGQRGKQGGTPQTSGKSSSILVSTCSKGANGEAHQVGQVVCLKTKPKRNWIASEVAEGHRYTDIAHV